MSDIVYRVGEEYPTMTTIKIENFKPPQSTISEFADV